MTIEERAAQIKQRIRASARGREIKIIGVTKTVPVDRIEEAYRAGIRIFGENRIQEALPKISALSGLQIEWHFIGHLQTNKAKEAVRNFQWIHSIDSTKLLVHVEKEAGKLEKPMNVLLEVNLANEESKHGFSEDGVAEGLRLTRDLKWCKICGLMIIPPFEPDPENTRPFFKKLRKLAERHRSDYPELLELSMGMSHDYDIAVQEGATMVRIGTALFGEREK
jgi:pyridoxal phosphate enzyme (YggS family)